MNLVADGGPARDGVSAEKGLPEKWSPAGENLAWKAPYGGRSAPIVMGDRVYLINTAGQGETLQERIICFNADTGKLLWETTLPAAGFATPATYAINGRQYIVIACGGGKLGTQSGDAYVAFALPERD